MVEKVTILEKHLTGVRAVFISSKDTWTGMCSCLDVFYTFLETNVGLIFGYTHLTMNGHKGSISVGICLMSFYHRVQTCDNGIKPYQPRVSML